MTTPQRVGLIGTGFMGSVHRAAWRGVGTPVTDLLVRPGAPVAPEFSGMTVHTDLDDFLAAVDVVDICTPTDTHVDLALAAARAGRPTLCEKPLSVDVTDALRVVAAFDRAGVPLQVAHVVRFFPEYVAAREAVVRGDIGEPAVLRLARLSFAPDRGADSWFADERRSGGLFFDLMIHDLDYARWVAGEVVRVHARATEGPRSYGIAVLTHASGAISHIEASWAEPAPVFRTRLEIAGSRGLLTCDSAETVPIVVRLHGDVPTASTGLADVTAANPFEAEIRHFLDVVAGVGQPALSAMDAVAAVWMAEAAARSARTGSPVTLDALKGTAA
jgi:myo-inositol 2-dehydrogenase/D-chiro-inositol 1-dehydrogenase